MRPASLAGPPACAWPRYAPGVPFPPALQLTVAEFRAHGLAVSEPQAETESLEYAAHRLAVNGQAVAFRSARTTPKKTGQFVTLWQRTTSGGGGPIRPQRWQLEFYRPLEHAPTAGNPSGFPTVNPMQGANIPEPWRRTE